MSVVDLLRTPQAVCGRVPGRINDLIIPYRASGLV